MAEARQITGLGRGGTLGFVAVVVITYVSAMSYLQRPLSRLEAVTLVSAGVLYLLVGIFGYDYCKRTGSRVAAAVYFAIQIPLAATIVYQTNTGFVFLILLVLASQSVVILPSRWMLVLCAVILALLITPVVIRFGWKLAARASVAFVAGIVFVVAFTQMAVNEKRARAEVERLVAQLGEANRQLREYAAQVEELATTKERNRLAREIHDSLGHYLTVVNVQIEAARAVLDSDRQLALDGMRKAQVLTQEGLAEVRRSVAALRASPTEMRPLPEALETLVEESRAAGILTKLAITGERRRLSPQAELTFYRAVQEGLTNVRKHAHASVAEVKLYYKTGRTLLVVEDDGVGASSTNSGFGLFGVRERAQALGGEVRVHSASGSGFRLEVELPE